VVADTRYPARSIQGQSIERRGCRGGLTAASARSCASAEVRSGRKRGTETLVWVGVAKVGLDYALQFACHIPYDAYGNASGFSIRN
jgi:hypothetical protein